MNNPDIILIVLDALRKDYSILLKNMLDKLGFISYENVISPASWTTPSHASMFLGMYPLYHGVHETKTKKLKNVRLSKRRDILIQSILSNMGYQTFLFTANPLITPRFGFVGFDYVYEGISLGRYPIRSKDEIEFLKEFKRKFNIKSHFTLFKLLLMKGHFKLLLKSIYDRIIEPRIRFLIQVIKNWPLDKGARNIVEKLGRVLLTSNGNPCFIFINLMETHEPYSLINEKYSRSLYLDNLRLNKSIHECAKQWKEKYPRAVKYASHKVMEIMNILMERKMFDNSLIIITSDHGQLLGEHGRIGHGTFLYDELLLVPLLVKYPQNMKVKVNHEVAKYASLVNLKSFILNLIKNKVVDHEILFSDTVFSESYGIHLSYDKKLSEEFKDFEKYKIAVYSGDFKGIFNVDDWKFEKILSYNEHTTPTEDDIINLKRKIINFLKVATMTRFKKLMLETKKTL